MTPEIEFENSSGNVIADLGLDDADELYTRAALGISVASPITSSERCTALMAKCTEYGKDGLSSKPPVTSSIFADG